MTRETSAEIASIAARLMGMSPQAMAEAHASEGKEFAEQVRRVAAAALGQREEGIPGWLFHLEVGEPIKSETATREELLRVMEFLRKDLDRRRGIPPAREEEITGIAPEGLRVP